MMGSLPNLNDLSKIMEQRHNWSPSTTVKKITLATVRADRMNAITQLAARKTYNSRHRKSRSVDRRYDVNLKLEPLSSWSPLASLTSQICSTSRTVSIPFHQQLHQHLRIHHPQQQQQQHIRPSSHLNPTINAPHRDSTTSSAGTSSVRQLIAVVRSTPSQNGPIYSRSVLCKNFVALCLAHAMLTAAFVPLNAFQSSISSWYWSESDFILYPTYSHVDVGSLLLSLLCFLGAISSLFMPIFVRQFKINWILSFCYMASVFFFGVHVYPKIYTLIPGYIVMGLFIGLMNGSKITALVTIATKLTHVLSADEENEVLDAEGLGRKEVIIQKLSRWLQFSQDIGLIVGNFVVAILLRYVSDAVPEVRDTSLAIHSIFESNNDGERVCGASACSVPTDSAKFITCTGNSSTVPLIMSCKGSTLLAGVFIGYSVMALLLTALLMDDLRLHMFQERTYKNFKAAVKIVKHTFKDIHLLLATPLAVFIGLEQGVFYGDFTKSYIVCTMGIRNIPLVFSSLGLLQIIAAFTLNLAIQHLKRYFAILGGFAFHGCLIMVLMLWKPSWDDSALLYVIASAWGVCNAVWETVIFNMIISIYPDNWQTAIGHNYFFRFLGMCIAYAFHGLLCNDIKLYALAGSLVLGVLPYTWLEIYLSKTRNQNV